MDLYARVNILEGRAVRLGRGSLDDVTSLDADPLNRARGWVEMGVNHLLVVDLDAAAYRSYRNRPLIDRMLEALDVPVVVAGGIRSEREAARLIERGAWKVTMGTAAIEHTPMVWDLCRDYPGRMMISLDVLENEELVTRGWTSNSGRFLEEVMVEMASCGVSGFLVADARRDVLTEAPDVEILRTALEYVDEPVIAAGGVRHLDDLRMLRSIEVAGRSLGGVVVGREVTEGRFTIAEAVALLSAPTGGAASVGEMRVVIPCHDLDKGVHFYERVLGLERLDPAGAASALFGLGEGRSLELAPEADTDLYPAGRRLTLALAVDDVDTWRARVERLGILTAPHADEVPDAFRIDGPDGVAVTVSGPPDPPPTVRFR